MIHNQTHPVSFLPEFPSTLTTVLGAIMLQLMIQYPVHSQLSGALPVGRCVPGCKQVGVVESSEV